MSHHAAKNLEELALEQITAGQMDPDRLDAMKKLILEDKKIDDQEVAILRTMIQKTRKGTPLPVQRLEVEFLFDLNEATVGGRNDDTWKTFFVETVAAHLLDDESTPGVIDEKEASWLIDIIERDKQYDPNEIALLMHVRNHAKEIPITVKFRLGMILSLT